MIKEFLQKEKTRILEELFEFLRIQSVSTDDKFKDEIIKCAEFIKIKLSNIGIDKIEIFQTKRHPIIFAEKIINKDLPTVLIYGHYDVQPADPYELWETHPFEPTIRNEKIYARGSSDDKGQLYMHIIAYEYLVKNNLLNCNVKFLFEGEEEIGSENLEEFVIKNKELLKADTLLISDTTMIDVQTPCITTGLRGLCYMELEVTGPDRDLHSGLFGGSVPNPANILSKIISSLHDDENKITVPGFYDNVIQYNEQQREELSQVPFSEERYCESLGIKNTYGEKGYTPNEQNSIRPTLDVNGIWGGYTNEGAKTIIPSVASAKISMRLVPNQSSEEIAQKFMTHIHNISPKSVKVKITNIHNGEAFGLTEENDAYNSVEKAMLKSFGKKPIQLKSGGSIPITALFEKELGLKSILMGFGLNEDKIHSPNESYGLFNFFIGIETIVYFYDYYSSTK